MKDNKNFVDRYLCLIVGIPSSIIITLIGYYTYQKSDLYTNYGFFIFLGILLMQCITINIVRKFRK